MFKLLKPSALLIFLSLAISSSGLCSDVNATNYLGLGAATNELPENILRMGEGDYFPKYAFVVDKTARRLEVWGLNNGQMQRVVAVPADMGKNSGDKKAVGDHKTPEGIYFLRERLDGQQLDFLQYGSRAFTTDYPNFFDRLEGKTGYGIWLHAVPDLISLDRGSRGCVVVRDAVIKELTQYVKLGQTPILIASNIQYLKKSEHEKRQSELSAWVESWREAWVSKNVDDYIKFYDDQFQSMKMNKTQWYDYKKGISENYDYLNVRLSKPVMYLYGDEAVVRTVQHYQSDKYQDLGEKILYLKKQGQGGFKIVGEDWNPIKNKSLVEQLLNEASSTSIVGVPHGKQVAN